MKGIFNSLLLMLCVLSASAAKKPVIWEKPSYVSTSISRLKLNSVEFHDTATIVKAQITRPEICIRNYVHLYGEDGKNYNLKFVKEFNVDSPIPVDEHDVASMTLVFEPMPSTTTYFDMLEDFGSNADHVWGISDAKKPLVVKPYEVNEQKVSEFRRDYFRTDTAYIKGRISSEELAKEINSLNILNRNVFTGEDEPIVIEVKADGTFEKKFVLQYPIYNKFFVNERFIDKPFIIKPGDKLNFDISWENYDYKITINDDSGKPYEYPVMPTGVLDSWENCQKKNWNKISNTLSFNNFCKEMEKGYDDAIAAHDYLAQRFHYNDIEYLMEKNYIQIEFALNIGHYYLVCEQLRKYKNVDELPDSLKGFIYPENFAFWRKLQLSDQMKISTSNYPFFIGNCTNSPVYVRGTRKRVDSPEGSSLTFYEVKPDPYVDSVLISRDKAIYGAETISLPLKIKFLQDFYWSSKGGKYNYLIMKAGIKRIFPADSVDIVFNDSIAKINQRANVIKAALNDAMLEAMIDKWLDKGLNDKEITYTLPECEGSSILKKITDKYKGKYVFLDFWATYCGPCRAGIESSKAWREELRNNPDFEFVFITGDRSSPQAAYDEYVAQNLNGAECYRIPEKEYQKLWELFKFTGIPHYEALDPKGDVLTKFNKYYLGKEIFLSDIEMLKNMQK